jgi:outer membrane protein TolC
MNRLANPTSRVVARAPGRHARLAIALTGLCLNLMPAFAQTQTSPENQPPTVALTLEQTLRLANESDDERDRLQQLGLAWQQEAKVVGYWPKPKLSLAAMNLPTDSLDLHQEPMTQLHLSYIQPLPKGNRRALSEDIRRLQAKTTEYQLDLRARERARQVALLWLAVQQPAHAQALVKDQLQILESMRDNLLARYQYSSLSSAMNSGTAGMGQTAQQDLILVELKQESLRDQLLMLEQQAMAARETLNVWLPTRAHQTPLTELPAEMHLHTLAYSQRGEISTFDTALKAHPAWRLAEHQNRIANRRIDLAREEDRPQWALQASYGYRADDRLGNDRADFVSLGVSMEVPWLNSGQANARQASARARAQAELIDQNLLMRRLKSQTASWNQRLQWQQARIERFDTYQVPKLNHSIQAARANYQHNRGHFNRLLDAHMALLAGNLERLTLRVDRLRAEVQLAYFIEPTDNTNALPASTRHPNPLTPEDNHHD